MKQQVIIEPIIKGRTQTILTKRDELMRIKEETDAMLEQINLELLDRVKENNNLPLVIKNRKVMLIQRLSFSKVPVALARKLNALKQVPDSTKLKDLYEAGETIEGVTTSEYIKVS